MTETKPESTVGGRVREWWIHNRNVLTPGMMVPILDAAFECEELRRELSHLRAVRDEQVRCFLVRAEKAEARVRELESK